MCCNEERQIRRCLESVRFCDEIVVVDSGSTDRTLEICAEFTSKISHRDWQGYVLQKRFALSQCNSDWVLNIDADEEVSEELQDEILQILRDDKAGRFSSNGFLLNRVVFSSIAGGERGAGTQSTDFACAGAPLQLGVARIRTKKPALPAKRGAARVSCITTRSRTSLTTCAA